ncbi:hypothetical protein N658DRAFT_69534 [Parathielavia hyrcaniae]|uniref:Uncharacterized protein n=1 Tax=Parathielavia hyrcaniae TaxID=113614 RepID=A0AAN6T242_9PEZI|nr:hypothetical protein N658DRAFT_69534 [Parathielavia hyrcaniae]
MDGPGEDGKGASPDALSLASSLSTSFSQPQAAKRSFPNAPAANTHTSVTPRFWELSERPQRTSAPRRFPMSTHQPPDTILGIEPAAASSLPTIRHDSPLTRTDPEQQRAESETMTPWQPHTGTRRGADDGLAAIMASAALAAGPRQGAFVASPADALLLNAMDHQRGSAERWMDMLQRPPGGRNRGEPHAVDDKEEEEAEWVLARVHVGGHDACVHVPVGGTCSVCGRTLPVEEYGGELGVMDEAGIEALWKYLYGDGTG